MSQWSRHANRDPFQVQATAASYCASCRVFNVYLLVVGELGGCKQTVSAANFSSSSPLVLL